MRTTPITPDVLRSSVIAVPPLARRADLSLDMEQNVRQLRHLEDGGVTSVLYGGNANIYHIGCRQYEELFGALPDVADASTWIVPSVGPSFGTAIDHAEILAGLGYPTAMVLPYAGPATPEGRAEGMRRIARHLGTQIVLYLKEEHHLTPSLVASLVDEGLVCAIKYAVVRSDPRHDPYLERILDVVDPSLVVSGIGERPAVVHLRDAGLSAFTSGSTCIAPKQSTAILHALHAGRFDDAETLRRRFLPLEDLRDAIHPIRVLHDAVTLAGVAHMGPILPLASNLDAGDAERVRVAASALLAQEPGHDATDSLP